MRSLSPTVRLQFKLQFKMCKFQVILPIALLLALLFPLPAMAVSSVERTPLTLELLQERLENPIQEEGRNTIDLRQLAIDLSEPNAEFRDRFYQALQAQLNRTKTPFNVDLSQSVIRGDFSLEAWGIKAQLVEEVLSGLLSPEEWDVLQQKLQPPRSPDRGEQFQQIPYITLFRGTLKLEETRFLGKVDFANTLFVLPFDAVGATFKQESIWSQTYFLETANFRSATFAGDAVFANSHFLAAARFDLAQFQASANFPAAIFVQFADFTEASFAGLANWEGTSWQKGASFPQTQWRDRVLFGNSFVLQSLDFSNATFEKAVSFRGSLFNAPINLQGASLLEQMDFSNALFARAAYLNVEDLALDAGAAKILGDTGSIGRVLRVSHLKGNERVLQSLVRNFRRLEQIADANQVDSLRSRLRAQQLRTHLKFSPFSLGVLGCWIGLSLLLLLSDYGTNFGLVLTVGLLSSACFGVLFWTVDRARRRFPEPILPTVGETTAMFSSFGAIAFCCLFAIFQTASQPLLTLACLSAIVLPVPLLLVGLLYGKGRYHDLMKESYLVEDGELRRLRVLIARLPIMPRFYFFRDRYMPVLSDRRWSWLNYYDFSLNNLLKFGFNDLRLRDRHLPGLISALVWYQWSLGILYIALLFWTLSRTIPGLNLLIYLS